MFVTLGYRKAIVEKEDSEWVGQFTDEPGTEFICNTKSELIAEMQAVAPVSVSTFQYDDGGRAESGFKGEADDCACRAIAIATGESYLTIYNRIKEEAKPERRSRKSHPRNGVYAKLVGRILKSYDFEWVPAMKIGSGCTVHLNKDELPEGTLVARVSKHFVAVIDGVIYDIQDPSRGGSRCVYGYWIQNK